MTVGQALEDPRSRAVFQKYLPKLVQHPMVHMAKGFKLEELVQYAGKGNISAQTIAAIRTELEKLNL